MTRAARRGEVAIVLILLTACGAPSSQNAEDEASTARETADAASALSTPPSPSATTTAPSESAADASDAELIRNFVAFAADPSKKSAADVPFARTIDLGLGRDIRTTLGSSTLHDADSWSLPARVFRAYTGPFSALTLLNTHARKAGSDAVGSDGAFEVSVGAHPHCASPPEAAPKGLESLRRVSVQPAERSIDSCLSWFTVDLFLDRDRSITTVTLDLWEP